MRQNTVFLATEFAETQIPGDSGAPAPQGATYLGIYQRDLQQAAVAGLISNLQASRLWLRLQASATPLQSAGASAYVPSPGYLDTAPQALLAMPDPAAAHGRAGRRVRRVGLLLLAAALGFAAGWWLRG